jgi:hypothetical protein
MLFTSFNFSSKKDYYISFYETYQPKKNHSLEHRIHSIVGKLISSQLEEVYDCDDLSLATKLLDKFIRELKVEFDCVNCNFEKFEYPPIISKLEGLIPNEVFKKYHSSIIDLLKVLLFRVSESQFPKEAENKVCTFATAFVNQLNPSCATMKLFTDKPEDPNKNKNKNLKIEEIIQKQIDIALDSDH